MTSEAFFDEMNVGENLCPSIQYIFHFYRNVILPMINLLKNMLKL